MGIDTKTLEQSQEHIFFQGLKAEEAFAGQIPTLHLIYGESAPDFADIIKAKITVGPDNSLADFGGYKGELMRDVLVLLPEYNFRTICFDRPEHLTDNKVAKIKIACDLSDLPAADQSIEAGFIRYALQWNSEDKQRAMLRRMRKVVQRLLIVQTAGPDNDEAEEWRRTFDILLGGKEVPALARTGHFFSSGKETEKYLIESGMNNFKMLCEKLVDKGLSSVLTNRFDVGEKDAEITRQILGTKDYIMRRTWAVDLN